MSINSKKCRECKRVYDFKECPYCREERGGEGDEKI